MLHQKICTQYERMQYRRNKDMKQKTKNKNGKCKHNYIDNILNVNELNKPIKRQKLSNWIKKTV